MIYFAKKKHFFKLEITLSKTGEHLQGMEYKKRRRKRLKANQKAVMKEPKDKTCLFYTP